MIAEYAAACGLLGGLRRNSFKDEELGRIEKQGRLALISFLKKYLGEDYPFQEDARHFERALYIWHIKRTAKLLKFLPPQACEVIKILLLEFDLLNLKLIIRRTQLNTQEGSDLFYRGFACLTFKDKDPADFKRIEELNLYLKKKPLIGKIFYKAWGDFKFYKDIFYFDIRLDTEYLKLLKNSLADLDCSSKDLLESFIHLRILMFALRLRFFQGRDTDQIKSLLGGKGFFKDDVLSRVLGASSLKEAVSVIERDVIFSRFKTQLSVDFEEDLRRIFYWKFLKRRGINFFSLYPYLIFYLKQRYFIEKLIFLINQHIV